MIANENSFQNLIDSFRIVCANLETKAELELQEIKNKYAEDFGESFKNLKKFDEILSGIGESCLELINNKENISTAFTAKNITNNSATVSCQIQPAIVQCISEIYNMPSKQADSFEKLGSEKNKNLVLNLIKDCENRVFEMKDSKKTVIDVRKNSNIIE